MSGFPFTIFKRANSPYYYVRFKNELTGGYSKKQFSTKETKRSEAVKVAMDWYLNGIQNTSVRQITDFSEYCEKFVKSIDDAVKIVEALKKTGFVKSAVFKNSDADILFTEYLIDFWTWEKSLFVKEKLRKQHGIHKDYIHNQCLTVKKYWLDYFENTTLGSVTRKDLKMFIDNKIASLNLSFARKKSISLAGIQPLRFAFNNEIIDRDITSGILLFSGKSKQRKVLTREMVQALFLTQWEDEMSYVACLVACFCGLRIGEVRALRRQDLGNGRLYVNHNWSSAEGLKTIKNNETRIVEIFIEVENLLLELLNKSPHSYSLDNFIFYSPFFNDKPIDGKVFLKNFRKALRSIGMSEAQAKEYDFHGLRHFYTTHMKGRVSDKLLQSQTGHKTHKMLDHYAEHEIIGEREKIRTAQKEAFGQLLPNKS